VSKYAPRFRLLRYTGPFRLASGPSKMTRNRSIALSPARIIRPAAQFNEDAIWRVIEPVFRAGETYPLPREISRDDAFAYWRASGNEVFVAEDGGRIVGTLLARQQSRRRQPCCELRLYCRGKRQSTRGGTGDVRAFAGASARAWLYRHAVQFCNFQQ
jgi:hypothetical protein